LLFFKPAISFRKVAGEAASTRRKYTFQ